MDGDRSTGSSSARGHGVAPFISVPASMVVVVMAVVLALVTAGGAGASGIRPQGARTLATVPAAPAKPRVVSGDHSVKVSWTAPTDGGSPIISYTATSSPTGETCTTTGGLLCTITTLKNGTTYTITVSAHNIHGTSLQSPRSTPVTPATVPSPPPGVSAVRNDGAITITWTASTGEGSPITAYSVYRGITPGTEGRTPIVTVGAAQFTFTDTTVVPGLTYYYVVTATNSAGVSNRSTQASASILAAGSGGSHMAATPTDAGYWIVSSDGGVFSYRAARFFGSLPGLGISVDDIVGIAATPSGHGYWLVGSDGGIFSFGDARFYGSMGGKPLNQPVVGIAATPTGAGYWEVASDGGIFSFGDARFHGSTGSLRLNEPIVAMTAMPTAHGYWLVASDGGIFAFTAPYFGSTGSNPPPVPVYGLVATVAGRIYTVVDASGEGFRFGD